ncbi:MAG: hypothetical protein AMS14_06585, partial [Planctomycetes bacterium DG_20]
MVDLALAVGAVLGAALLFPFNGFPAGLDAAFGLGVGPAHPDFLAKDIHLFAKAFLLFDRQDRRHVDGAIGLGERPFGLHVVFGPSVLGAVHAAFGLGEEFLDARDDPLAFQRPHVADDVAEGLFPLRQQFHRLVEPLLGLGRLGPQVQGLGEVDLGLLILVPGECVVAEFHFIFGPGTVGLPGQRHGVELRLRRGFGGRLGGGLGGRFGGG